MDEFAECLANVVRALSLDVAAETESDEREVSVSRVRTAVRNACRQGLKVSGESFDALVRAAVHNPGPSFNRVFLKPARNALERGRVQVAPPLRWPRCAVTE
ncbi:hypothetical protein ACH4E8_15965 [Streptomyces sp. NPDC017979]|uniref:hypothetical protein n=1 Tax=Streptomyces sp. NPDC017979 TaxID=3365024 RepID=UPI00378AB583